MEEERGVRGLIAILHRHILQDSITLIQDYRCGICLVKSYLLGKELYKEGICCSVFLSHLAAFLSIRHGRLNLRGP